MSEITSRLSTALADRYRIEHRLGEGGMAMVYLAEDLKHRRKVALKVLRPELAAVLGAERFVQEITTTASLQHPHILPLFDSGEADGFLYYVMPYIEGETLRERLNREKQLGIDEAVRVATEAADALHHAHGQGVIHRDIKPENILLQDGRPMVADFGIALAVSAAAGGRMTETGLSLGTPHYMSPEQATAEKDITARSDVYSLGSVLYEMLTGEPPHMGTSAQQIIMKIVTDTPRPVTELRRSVPPNVAAAVAKSLEKLPADRFQSAKEFSDALANPAFTSATTSVAGARGPIADAGWRTRFMVTAAAAAILLVATVVGWVRGPVAIDAEPVRFAEQLPNTRISLALAVAPDGRSFVVTDQSGQLALRRLGETGFRVLDAEGSLPVFSPDGRSVLVLSPGPALVVVPVDGGPTRTLVTTTFTGASFAWGDDGYIYLGVNGGAGIGRIPEGGGAVDTLFEAPGRHFVECVLPRGRGMIFASFGEAGAAGTLKVLRPEDGTVVDLGMVPGVGIEYSETGHLLYAREQFVLAHPFDIRRLALTGDAVPVAEVTSGGILFAYRGGTLLTTSASGTYGLQPFLVDRNGRQVALPGLGEASFNFPEVAPDGRRIAVTLTGSDINAGDVWVYQMPDGPLTRLTRSGAASTTSWTLDGDEIVFIQDGNAYRVRSDGSNEPTLVLDREAILSRAVVGPDGTTLFLQERPGAWDIGVATLDSPGSDSLLFAGDYWEGHPTPSPNGRWLAYYSNESDRLETYVRPLSGPGRRHQVSREGGLRPRWSDDGTELFFWDDGWIYVAALQVGADIVVRSVERLIEAAGAQYDVFPGDSLFVVLNVPPDTEEADDRDALIVTINFDAVLRGLANRR